MVKVATYDRTIVRCRAGAVLCLEVVKDIREPAPHSQNLVRGYGKSSRARSNITKDSIVPFMLGDMQVYQQINS